MIEAKEEIIKNRNEAEKDIKERRIERQDKNDVFNKRRKSWQKLDNLERKEELLQQKTKIAEDRLAEAEVIKKVNLIFLKEYLNLQWNKLKSIC